MTVKYENEVYDSLENKQLTCSQIRAETGIKFYRVWTALTQLEQKGLVDVGTDYKWTRTNKIKE